MLDTNEFLGNHVFQRYPKSFQDTLKFSSPNDARGFAYHLWGAAHQADTVARLRVPAHQGIGMSLDFALKSMPEQIHPKHAELLKELASRVDKGGKMSIPKRKSNWVGRVNKKLRKVSLLPEQ